MSIQTTYNTATSAHLYILYFIFTVSSHETCITFLDLTLRNHFEYWFQTLAHVEKYWKGGEMWLHRPQFSISTYFIETLPSPPKIGKYLNTEMMTRKVDFCAD